VFITLIATLQIAEALKRHRDTMNNTFIFKLHHLLFILHGQIWIMTWKNLKIVGLNTYARALGMWGGNGTENWYLVDLGWMKDACMHEKANYGLVNVRTNGEWLAAGRVFNKRKRKGKGRYAKSLWDWERYAFNLKNAKHACMTDNLLENAS